MRWRLAQSITVLALLSAVVCMESADDDEHCHRFNASPHRCTKYTTIEHLDYDIECPASANVDISYFIDDKKVCNISTNTSLPLEILCDLRIGWVDELILYGFSLTNVSVSKIIVNAGINIAETLEINNNINTTFESKTFKNLGNITLLSVNNNDMTKLPGDLFEGLNNLEKLRMKHNFIDFPETLFSNTPNLNYIELENNSIIKFKPEVFSKSSRLLYLELRNIRFVNTPSSIIDHLQQNTNETITLPHGLLSNLSLNTIILAGCNVMALPEDLFWGSGNITELILKQNVLTNLYENTFRDLRLLKNLDLSKNRISQLPKRLFNNTADLLYLDLSENNISHLPESLFRTTYNLKTLKLNMNKIKEIPSDLFQNLMKLECLYLGFNQIDHIDSFSLFPSKYLKVLDMSNNNLSTVKQDTSIFHIKELILANNSLTAFHDSWLNIKQLDLSFNNIKFYQIKNMNPPSYSIHINLMNNNINTIHVQQSYDNDTTLNFQPTKYFINFYLDNNPINCDCHLLPFVHLYRLTLSPQNNYFKYIRINSSTLKCSEPKQLSNKIISKVADSSLTCDLRHSEDYSCPKNCSCEYRAIDQGNIITCHYARLPKQLTVNSAANHTELNIVGGHLEQLLLPDSNGYDNVTHWRLSGNDIEDIRLAERLADKLELLDLSSNKLTKLSADTTQLLTRATHLDTIFLHDNPWKCDCDTKFLRTLLIDKYTQVKAIKNVTCSDGIPIIHLEEIDLCPLPFFKTDLFVTICSISAVLGLVIATVTVLYFKYQQHIRIYCYSSRWRALRWLVSRPDADEGKKYDAFISYAHQDETFVTDHLVPYLEQGETKFRACLHYRDWTPGESIQLQILKSIKESRRTIVVLSPSYLASDWGRMEFTAAYDEALQDGKTRVVVIMYQDVGPIDQLDDRIRIHLQVNTYLKWGSRWFWQQLSFAMPHPSEDRDDVICVFCPRANRNQRDDRMLSMNET